MPSAARTATASVRRRAKRAGKRKPSKPREEPHEVPRGASEHQHRRDARGEHPAARAPHPHHREAHHRDTQVEAHLPVVHPRAPVAGAAVVVGLVDVRGAVEAEGVREHGADELLERHRADAGEGRGHPAVATGEAHEFERREELGGRDHPAGHRRADPPEERHATHRRERVHREPEPEERRDLRVSGQPHHADRHGDEPLPPPPVRPRRGPEQRPAEPRRGVLHAQVERVGDEEAGPGIGEPADDRPHRGDRAAPRARPKERPHAERRPHLVEQDARVERERVGQQEEETHRRRVEEAPLPLREQREAVAGARGPPRHGAGRPHGRRPRAPRVVVVAQVVVPEHALARHRVGRERDRHHDEHRERDEDGARARRHGHSWYPSALSISLVSTPAVVPTASRRVATLARPLCTAAGWSAEMSTSSPGSVVRS